MNEFFRFDNEKEDSFFKEGGVDYSKLPISLIRKYPKLLDEIGVVRNCSIALYCEENKLVMPLLIVLDEIGCSINMINTRIFENINTLDLNHWDYLITDSPKIRKFIKCHKLIFFEKQIYLYKLSQVNENNNVHYEQEYVFYTSGTTGDYTKVIKTDEILIHEAQGIIKSLKINSDDKILCIAPLFHSFGQAFGCFASALGGAWVKYLPSFTLPTHIISELKKQDYSILITTPQYYERIYNNIEEIKSLRYMLSAGGNLSKDLINSGVRINNVYGTTETGAITIQRYENGGDCSCVGTEISGVSIILGEEIQRDTNNSIRELFVNTPYLALRTIADSGTIEFKNHYMKLSDIGYRDENGNIKVCGRLDNIVNINGEKVSLYEIEDTFKNMRFVKEVKVVKDIDEKQLEYLIAYVILNEKVDISLIRKSCSEHLENYKIPKIIKVIDKLKQTEMGKVLNKQE